MLPHCCAEASSAGVSCWTGSLFLRPMPNRFLNLNRLLDRNGLFKLNKVFNLEWLLKTHGLRNMNEQCLKPEQASGPKRAAED